MSRNSKGIALTDRQTETQTQTDTQTVRKHYLSAYAGGKKWHFWTYTVNLGV